MTINKIPSRSRSGNWNEKNLNHLSGINWRSSMVPSTAVIPAPISYIEVVAVKKVVVGLLVGAIGRTLCVVTRIISCHPWIDRVCN